MKSKRELRLEAFVREMAICHNCGESEACDIDCYADKDYPQAFKRISDARALLKDEEF